MKPINDGGEAFPRAGAFSPDHGYADQGACGMSLRDWFAGQALAGLLAGQYRESGHHNLLGVPREAYSIADAMLAAREDSR